MTPRFLAMVSVVAVFVPSFFMTGVSRSLFVPLSLAVGLAMVASFLLSSSLVPVLSVWLLARHPALPEGDGHQPDWVERLRARLARLLQRLAPARGLVVGAYAVVTVAIVTIVGLRLGREILPPQALISFNSGFGRPRARCSSEPSDSPARYSKRFNAAAGPGNVDITLGYIGVQPSSYPINTIFLWTGGSHEGVLQVALKPDAPIRLPDFEEILRRRFTERFPVAQFSFEPGDIVSRIMNFSATTPVEVAVMGSDFSAIRAFAMKVRDQLARIHPCAIFRWSRRSTILPCRWTSIASWPVSWESLSIRSVAHSRRQLVQPLRRAELLGRPRHRNSVSGSGRSPAAADDQPRRPARRARYPESDAASAPRGRGTNRERHHRRRVRSHQRPADGYVVGERERGGFRPGRHSVSIKPSPAPDQPRAAPRSAFADRSPRCARPSPTLRRACWSQ